MTGGVKRLRSTNQPEKSPCLRTPFLAGLGDVQRFWELVLVFLRVAKITVFAFPIYQTVKSQGWLD